MALSMIEKRSHPLIHHARQIRDGKDKSFFFCEGQKIVEELFKSSLVPIRLFCTKERAGEMKALLAKNKSVSAETILVSPSVMAFLSDVKAAPGVVALGRRPTAKNQIDFDKLKQGLILVLSGLQLPQNVGALIRSAEAAGTNEVWLTEESVDAYSPKAIRGSAGSVFRVPIRQGLKLHATLELLARHPFQIFAALQHGRISYDQVDWTGARALVIGSEAHGFSEPDLRLMSQTILIPMQGRVESLNAAVAGSVCLFEAARQRRVEGGSHLL